MPTSIPIIDFCNICGYRPEAAPWGDAGKDPSFEFCPCCKVEWGYQDSNPVAIGRFRTLWLQKGAPWSERRVEHDGLSTNERLAHIGVII